MDRQVCCRPGTRLRLMQSGDSSRKNTRNELSSLCVPVCPSVLSKSSLPASYFGQNSRGRKEEENPLEARASQARVKMGAVLTTINPVIGAVN